MHVFLALAGIATASNSLTSYLRRVKNMESNLLQMHVFFIPVIIFLYFYNLINSGIYIVYVCDIIYFF